MAGKISAVLGRPLTPADISKLWFMSPAEGSRLAFIPDQLAIRSETDFVTRVYSRAREVAKASGTTADELGYTKDAIRDAYAGMLKAMRADPATANLYHPRFHQWELLRNDLMQKSMARIGKDFPVISNLLFGASNIIFGVHFVASIIRGSIFYKYFILFHKVTKLHKFSKQKVIKI